jgi:hypothetical protein
LGLPGSSLGDPLLQACISFVQTCANAVVVIPPIDAIVPIVAKVTIAAAPITAIRAIDIICNNAE